MTMEFNRNQGERFFGSKSAVKDIRKHLQELKFDEIVAKGPHMRRCSIGNSVISSGSIWIFVRKTVLTILFFSG